MSGSFWLAGVASAAVAMGALAMSLFDRRASHHEEAQRQRERASAENTPLACQRWTTQRHEESARRQVQQVNEGTRLSHSSSSSSEALPAGWGVRYTTDNRIYYFHLPSQTATWARPTRESSRRLIAAAATRAAAAEAEEDEEAAADSQEECEEDEEEYRSEDGQGEEGSATSSESQELPCPLSLPVAADVDFKSRSLPACDWCSCACRVQCARCLDAFYCSEEHQQHDWFDSHAEQCDSFIEAIADQLGFSVRTMHTKLHPRRGSNVNPYTAWTFNVFARFYCNQCEGPRKSHRKGNGKRSRLQWASARTALDLSLTDLHIVHVYKQQCKRCGTDALPVVTRQELVAKVATLLRWLRDLRPGDRRDQSEVDQKQTPPHLAQFCEKCGYGANPQTH